MAAGLSASDYTQSFGLPTCFAPQSTISHRTVTNVSINFFTARSSIQTGIAGTLADA